MPSNLGAAEIRLRLFDNYVRIKDGKKFSREEMDAYIVMLKDTRPDDPKRRFWCSGIPGLENEDCATMRAALDRKKKDWVASLWNQRERMLEEEEHSTHSSGSYEGSDTDDGSIVYSGDENENNHQRHPHRESSESETTDMVQELRKTLFTPGKQNTTSSKSKQTLSHKKKSINKGLSSKKSIHNKTSTSSDISSTKKALGNTYHSQEAVQTPYPTHRKGQKSTKKKSKAPSTKKKNNQAVKYSAHKNSGEGGTSHQSWGGMDDTTYSSESSGEEQVVVSLKTLGDIMSTDNVVINDLVRDPNTLREVLTSLQTGVTNQLISNHVSDASKQEVKNDGLTTTIQGEETLHDSGIAEANECLSSLTSEFDEVTKTFSSLQSGVLALQAEMNQGSLLNSLDLKRILEGHVSSLAKQESDLNQQREGNDDTALGRTALEAQIKLEQKRVKKHLQVDAKINSELLKVMKDLEEEENDIHQDALGQISYCTKRLKELDVAIFNAEKELASKKTSKERAVTTAWAQLALMQLIVDCIRSAQSYPTLPPSERAKLDQDIEHCLEMIAFFRREKLSMDSDSTYSSGNTLLDSLRGNNVLHAPTASVMVPTPRMKGHQAAKSTNQYSIPTPSNHQQSQANFTHPQAAAQQHQTLSHTQVGGVGADASQPFRFGPFGQGGAVTTSGEGNGASATEAGGMNVQQVFGGQVSHQQGSVSQQAYDKSSSPTSSSVLAPSVVVNPTSSVVEEPAKSTNQYFLQTPSNQQQSQANFTHPQAAAQQHQTLSHTQVGGVGADASQPFRFGPFGQGGAVTTSGEGNGASATEAGGMNVQQVFGGQAPSHQSQAAANGDFQFQSYQAPILRPSASFLSNCSTMGDTVGTTKTNEQTLFEAQSIMRPSVQTSTSCQVQSSSAAGSFFKSSKRRFDAPVQTKVDLSAQAGGPQLPFSSFSQYSSVFSSTTSEEAPFNNVTTSAVAEETTFKPVPHTNFASSSLQKAVVVGNSVGLEGVAVFGAAQQTQEPPVNPVIQAQDNTDTQTVQSALTNLSMSSNKN